MSLRPHAWFRRLAEVPGVDFAGGPGIDRRRLPGHDARPQVSEFGLMWGRTSASPAHERAFSVDTREFSAAQLVRHVWETVELPAEPEDYHFALQHAVEQLWSLRSTNPECLAELEEFAYLDLALVEAAPWSLMFSSGDNTPTMVALPGVDRLIVLLEREGAHREALEVASRLVALGAVSSRLDRAQVRVATLDSFA